MIIYPRDYALYVRLFGFTLYTRALSVRGLTAFVARAIFLRRFSIMQLRSIMHAMRPAGKARRRLISGESVGDPKHRRRDRNIAAAAFPRGLIAAERVVNSRTFALAWHVAFF